MLTWGMVIFLGISLFAGLVVAGLLVGGGISATLGEFAGDWTQTKHWELLMRQCELRLDFETSEFDCPEWLIEEPDWDENPEGATLLRLVPKEPKEPETNEPST